MAALTLPLTVDNSALYKVRVNDGGADGGSTSELFIGGSPGGISAGDLDAAVQAFAGSLGNIPGFTVHSVTRLTAAETAV